MIKWRQRGVLALMCSALLPAVAFAAMPRVYLSGTGSDVGSCGITAPCRTLQFAMTAVDPGGDIVIRDSAGYGAVAIGQAVSIIAPRGVYAGITVASGIGIDVNASGAKVLLEGLTINGIGPATTGIRFAAGSQLEIVRCAISGMSDAGLVATAPSGRLQVFDTSFHQVNIGASFSGVSAVLERVETTTATLESLSVRRLASPCATARLSATARALLSEIPSEAPRRCSSNPRWSRRIPSGCASTRRVRVAMCSSTSFAARSRKEALTASSSMRRFLRWPWYP